MADPLGSSRVSSQKQNREGVVGAQSKEYRAMAESSPGRDVTPTPKKTIFRKDKKNYIFFIYDH